MGPKRKSGKRMSPAKRAKICTALESVSRHRSSIKKAARDNGLSSSFLYRRYMGEVDLYKVKGPKTIFTEKEENAMANWLQEMAQRGMGLRVCEFLDFVEELSSGQDAEIERPEIVCISQSQTMLLSNAVIKGYHAFAIKPPVGPIKLLVDKEFTNIHDENACLVWMPGLDQYPKEMHSQYTDTKRLLKLEDIAGLPVGHVPRSLGAFFRSVLDAGGHVHVLVIGEHVPSFPPWPTPNAEGGGVVIPCHYEITLPQDSLLEKFYEEVSYHRRYT